MPVNESRYSTVKCRLGVSVQYLSAMKRHLKYMIAFASALVICLMIVPLFMVHETTQSVTSHRYTRDEETSEALEQINERSIQGKCRHYYFPCDDSTDHFNRTICIHRSLHCDKKVHCPNGEDEKNCEYILPDLRTNYNVSTLNSNILSRYQGNFFGNCSLYDLISGQCGCNISHTEKADCKGQGFTEIPAFFEKSITSLNLDRNKITFIDPAKLSLYSNLILLSLRYNQITILYSRSFNNMTRLTRLYLRGNSISLVTQGAFEGLDSLEKLYLTENRIEWLDLNVFHHTPKLTFLDLSENNLKILSSQSFPSLSHLTWLDLSFNRIEKITCCLFLNLTSLIQLHLQDNMIYSIHSRAFVNQSKLTELNLNNNKVSYLPSNIFSNLLHLKTLELGHNRINKLPIDLLHRLTSLRMLNLTGIEIRNINRRHFSYNYNLSHLFMLRFKYCLYAPQVRVCHPSADGVSSLGHLLAHPIVRVCVWIVAVVTCVGNVIVLTWRSIGRKEDAILSLLVKNLSLADLMMGMYLVIVGSKDVGFKDKYLIYALEWMTSWKCTAVGCLAMTSCEVSVIILTIVAIERYRSIAYATRFLTLNSVRALVAFAWFVAFTLALYPIIFSSSTSETGFYGSNGLCFPLHIDDPFALGWQYSAFIFLGINFIAAVAMLVFYTRMFIILHRARATTQPALIDKAREDRVLAIRFFVIVLTDCLCWLPIVFIKILAFLPGQQISPTIYAWVVVFILPINSAINPIIYTMASPTFIGNKLLIAFHSLIAAGHKSLTFCTNQCPQKCGTTCSHSTTSFSCHSCTSNPRHNCGPLLPLDATPMDHFDSDQNKRTSDGSCVSLVTMSTNRTASTSASLAGSRRSSAACQATSTLTQVKSTSSLVTCDEHAKSAVTTCKLLGDYEGITVTQI